MRKNGGRIGERNEEITKKIKAKFLIERICKYEEYPKMVKEAGQQEKYNGEVKDLGMTKWRKGSEWKEDSLCKHYVRKPFQVNFI